MKTAVLLCALASTVSAAETFCLYIVVDYPWEYYYGDVAELSDGSIAVVNGMIMEDLQAFIFDGSGQFVTETERMSVPGRALESGGWLVPLPDGGFYMASYSEPRATGVDSDLAVFRVSGNYRVDWKQKTGEGTDDVYKCFGAAENPGGGVVVLGGEGYSGENAFLRAYTPDGGADWEHVYDEEEGYLPVSVGGVEDGVLVLMTHRWHEITLLQKFDGRGNMEWELEIPRPCSFGPCSFCSTDSGYGVYFSDRTDGIRSGTVVLAGKDGDLEEMNVFTHGIQLYDVLMEGESRVILAGSQVLDGERLAVVEACDYQGSTLWRRFLAGFEDAGFTKVCRCADGGYLLTGYCIEEEEAGSSGYLLVRTDENGCVGDRENPQLIPMPGRNPLLQPGE